MKMVELIPAIKGWKAGHTLDRLTQTDIHTRIDTYDQFRITN